MIAPSERTWRTFGAPLPLRAARRNSAIFSLVDLLGQHSPHYHGEYHRHATLRSPWQQSCLPLRLGGLGLRSASTFAHATYVTGILNVLHHGHSTLALPPGGDYTDASFPGWQASLRALQGQVGSELDPLKSWIASGLKLPPAGESCMDSNWWTDKIHQRSAAALVFQETERDCARWALQGSELGWQPNHQWGWDSGFKATCTNCS